MVCCPAAQTSTGRFFSRFARRYRRKYQRRGLERTQRQMVQALEGVAVAGRSLLEVGCGVGYLHQQLLLNGAASAVGVDLSEDMLKEARRFADERGLAGRVQYRQGDFIEMAADLPRFDITLMDKVICCDPRGEALVSAATDRTGLACVLTYPRGHWLNRAGAGLASFILRLVGSAYRPYVYDPAQVEAWFVERRFVRRESVSTLFWLTQVYVRA